MEFAALVITIQAHIIIIQDTEIQSPVNAKCGLCMSQALKEYGANLPHSYTVSDINAYAPPSPVSASLRIY